MCIRFSFVYGGKDCVGCGDEIRLCGIDFCLGKVK